MQEEQEGRKERQQEEPEENGPVEEVEDPSLAEDQAAAGEAEQVEEDEEESEPVEEIEDEYLVEEEVILRRGCLRGCLIPIAAILVICLAAVVIVHAKWGNVISAWVRQRIIVNTQNQVRSGLTDDKDREEIDAAFEKVKAALKEGKIDEEILDETIRQYQDATRGKLPPEGQVIDALKDGLNAAIIGNER